MMSMASLEQAAKLLRDGGVVAFPTETVYGLGANALLPEAVARVFEIKNRPRFDPLIVHVPQVEDVDRLVHHFPAIAQQLAQAFWPGPLTLVLPKRPNVPDLVTADLPTVAVRVPGHALTRELLELAAVPVAAPSANPFGQISPTTAEHVRRGLGTQVDCIVDGGACTTGVESTVIGFGDDGQTPTLLRPGGLPLEDIQQITGPLALPPRNMPQEHPQAPGMLDRHYAPRTPLILCQPHQVAQALGDSGGKRVGLLAYTSATPADKGAVVEVLSSQGNLREAAANLFAAMHRLDAQGLDLIVAEIVPNHGLGRAINDRLGRAARR